MKLKVILISMGCILSGAVLADTYSGTSMVKGVRGGAHSVAFTYKIDLSNKNNITGTLDIAGHATSCSGEHEIASGSIKDNIVTLRTKKPDGFKCGVIAFNGEVDGNKFVGKIPWNGAQVELTLEKQN